MKVWIAEYVYQSYATYSYHRIGLFSTKEKAQTAAKAEEYFPQQQGWAHFNGMYYIAFDLGRATIRVYEVDVH